MVTKNIFSDITPLSDNCGLAMDILSTAGHLGQLLPTSNESRESDISRPDQLEHGAGAGVNLVAQVIGQQVGTKHKIYIPVLIFQTIIFTFFSYLLEEKLCKKYKQT